MAGGVENWSPGGESGLRSLGLMASGVDLWLPKNRQPRLHNLALSASFLLLILVAEIPLPHKGSSPFSSLLLPPILPPHSHGPPAPGAPNSDHSVTQQRESPVLGKRVGRGRRDVVLAGEGGKLALFPFLPLFTSIPPTAD